MANEITSIKIGNVEYPIDFASHDKDLPVKLINAPSIATLQTYGLPSDYTSTWNRTEYFKAFLKYLLATAPGYTCIGYLSPSSRGSYICDVYNNGFNSETELPEHITGHYFQHAGTHTAFGTSFGNYYEYEYLNSNNFSGYAAIKNHTHSFTWNNNDTDIEAILGNLQSQITANANAILTKSDIHDHPYLPTAGGTMTGNISFDANRMIRWHNSDSYAISCPNTSSAAYMLINGFAGTTISKRLSVYKSATSAPNTSYHLYTDGSLYAASATIGGSTKITGGSDLTLQASSSASSDPGDLAFTNSSGTEIGRIWLDQGTNFKLRYGSSDAAKMIIHENNIGTYAALPNHTHSEYATAEALNDLDTRLDSKANNINMTGATSSAAGAAGLVPAPAAGKQSAFLRGDGTWATISSASYITPYSIIFEGNLPTYVDCTDNDYTDTLKFNKNVTSDNGFVYDDDRSIIKFYDEATDKSGKIGFTDTYGPNTCDPDFGYGNYLYLKSDYGTLIDATNGPLIINNENVSIFSNDEGPAKSSIKVPLYNNYEKTSSSSDYTVSSVYNSSITFQTTFPNGYTRNAISASATNVNISSSSTYKYFSIPAGQTIKLDIGASCIAYLNGKFVDLTSDYPCPECDSTLDSTYVYPHPYNIEDIFIRFYLTTSYSGSYTSAIAYKDLRLDAMMFAGLYKSSLNIGTTTYPGIYGDFEYTNTGSSSKSVYLRAVVLRKTTSQKTFTNSYDATWWLYHPYEYEYIMEDYDNHFCPCCGSCYSVTDNATIWSSFYRECVNNNSSTFTQYVRNVYTFYKESIYTKTNLQIPTSNKYVLINKDTLYLGNMNENDSDNSSYYANIINKEYILHKFSGYPSTFYLDYEKLNYNIYTSSSEDTGTYNPIISFNINTNGLHLYSANSSRQTQYYYKTDLTNNSELKLFYNTSGVTFKYNGLTPSSSGTFTLGSSSYRLGTIYSTAAINTSDERFKNWISDIDVDFEKLKKIPKKLFTWRDSFLKDDDDIHIGTSAQVIRDIYPEIVHVYNSDVDFCPPRDIYDPDAVLAIEYDKLGVIALAAVDKLHEENIQLKEENEQLKTRLDNLEAILKEKGIL